MRLRHLAQEVVEMGVHGTLFRARWEAQVRWDTWHRLLRIISPDPPAAKAPAQWTRKLPMADAASVAACMREHIPAKSLATLQERGTNARHNKIFCFGASTVDFGTPIDWYLQPRSGKRWPAEAGWWRSLANAQDVGDVKLTWEAARFPHAYHMARAAAFAPERAPQLAAALLTQMQQFSCAAPQPLGIHWLSGQEIAVRLLAWLFALDTLQVKSAVGELAAQHVAAALVTGATHIERYINLARFSVYNNHLLAEAVALLAAGTLLPNTSHAERWQRVGFALLEEAAERQVYADGAYIQDSHNYHRVALQYLLWAHALVGPSRASQTWLRAMERSLTFLLAHQNPTDGRLPNHGNNDGAIPCIWSTCDLGDFRPILQAVSLATRGERVYEPGPWDESAAWVLGPNALLAPLRAPSRKSVSFNFSGYHVLRGEDPATFATLRCGNVRERFSQIDMLHVDLWWRGHNMLVDGGSYMYNEAGPWHEHFLRTASHNTVMIDHRDQMLHVRRFKSIYLTPARRMAFNIHPEWQSVSGEHTGYVRHPGRCVHRRSLLCLHDDLWVIVDSLVGRGRHHARLHWLAGPFAYTYSAARLRLNTPAGVFSIIPYNAAAQPLQGSVVAGQDSPPRGWLSRHYAHKEAVPSLAVEIEAALPQTFISVMGANSPSLSKQAGAYTVHGAVTRRFTLVNGIPQQVAPETRPEADSRAAQTPQSDRPKAQR